MKTETQGNRTFHALVRFSVTAALLSGVGCAGGHRDAEILANSRSLSLDVCDPAGGPFSLEITNGFLPYPEGARWVLESDDERVQITVLADTEVVAGVTTRVVEERQWEGGELIEVSRNFVAQAPDGSVCFFGEDVDDYEDGEISGHTGGWRAGVAGAMPGILMAAQPEVGTSHAQESSPGKAEDVAVQGGHQRQDGVEDRRVPITGSHSSGHHDAGDGRLRGLQTAQIQSQDQRDPDNFLNRQGSNHGRGQGIRADTASG